jgi:hypothetical protein
MSVKWMKEWNTDDFLLFADKLDADTAFQLKEFVSKKIRAAEKRADVAEQELINQDCAREAALGHIQGS